MPKPTVEELCNSVHNWLQENNANNGNMSHKIVPQFVTFLEEWREVLTGDEPRVMKLRRTISTFCEKIVVDKRVEVGARARAEKFLLSEPEPVVAQPEPAQPEPAQPEPAQPEPAQPRPLVPWDGGDGWNQAPQAWRDMRDWFPEEEDRNNELHPEEENENNELYPEEDHGWYPEEEGGVDDLYI